MSTGKLKYLPPRFMTINIALEQLLEAEEAKKQVPTLLYFVMVFLVLKHGIRTLYIAPGILH